MASSVIESIRDYICDCPLLKDGKIGVDWLGDEPVEYVIEPVPAEPVVKRYADGGALKQCLFVFASRESYGADVLDNLGNCGFYESFAAWLEEKNNAGEYPALEGNKLATSIAATTCGYLFDATANTGRYQIQCNLQYQEG